MSGHYIPQSALVLSSNPEPDPIVLALFMLSAVLYFFGLAA